MEHNPDLTIRDNLGRTAVDFASALDGIWPFFAVSGCKRTPKAELIKMDIVKKVETDGKLPSSDRAYFSRPGSAYVIKTQSLYGEKSQNIRQAALNNGDVLTASDPLPSNSRLDSPAFSAWRSWSILLQNGFVTFMEFCQYLPKWCKILNIVLCINFIMSKHLWLSHAVVIWCLNVNVLNVCCCSVPSITLSGNADLQGGEGAMGVPTPLHKLQRCWTSWSTAATAVNNTDFQLYFYFCRFEIGTFSKTVKYIHKVVSVAKKSILKFTGVSNIHIFKFTFGCLFSHHTAFKTHKIHSDDFPQWCNLDCLTSWCKPWIL